MIRFKLSFNSITKKEREDIFVIEYLIIKIWLIMEHTRCDKVHICKLSSTSTYLIDFNGSLGLPMETEL